VIKLPSWGDFESDGLDLIDWNVDSRGLLVQVISISGLGADEVGGSRWSLLVLLFLLGMVVLLVVVLLALVGLFIFVFLRLIKL
jgi:hypothetical protein